MYDEMHLEGNERAAWLSKKDERSMSANNNMISESFVMCGGKYQEGVGELMDGDAVSDITPDWGSADKTPKV